MSSKSAALKAERACLEAEVAPLVSRLKEVTVELASEELAEATEQRNAARKKATVLGRDASEALAKESEAIVLQLLLEEWLKDISPHSSDYALAKSQCVDAAKLTKLAESRLKEVNRKLDEANEELRLAASKVDILEKEAKQ